MSFTWLLFDLDETLMEFKTASDGALRASFERFQLPQNKETVEAYHHINRQVWMEFEQGKISVQRLISDRMKRFLEAISALHRVDPNQLNNYYLDQLAQRSLYYPGTEDVLKTLMEKGFNMAIVTNGLSRVQRYRWQHTTLTEYFKDIFISEEIGHPKPHQAFFDHVHYHIGRPERHRVLVIGDNPESDIKGARGFGYKSCWINRGSARLSSPKSDFEIQDLSDLHSIL